jgi:hypothetical protein
MGAFRTAKFLGLSAILAATATAHPRPLSRAQGSLLAACVEIDGERSPLYPAPDGSGRYYVEARPGARYSVLLENRSAERLGVVLRVDGLNVISGERDTGRGRMYVLDPWRSATVRGWRTSLEEVRQFTFVDERASYAARSGKANEKMGWIELAVYREQRAIVQAPVLEAPPVASSTDEGRDRATAGAPPAPAVPDAEGHRDAARAEARLQSAPEASYPGTGWGRRSQDAAVLVSFRPETAPTECLTLRYEYRSGLVALGVLPVPPRLDRLHQRDSASAGFAQPPRW